MAPCERSTDDHLRALLVELAKGLGERVILWRGPELGGSDVDLLVLHGAEGELTAALRAAGLEPRPGDPGHVVWARPGTRLPPVDVLHSSAWPAYYPSLNGLLDRVERPPASPPISSPEDRLLIYASEAVAGRPLGRVAERARRLLEAPGSRRRLADTAESEGLQELAAFISRPDLPTLERRGRLPYGVAVALARRCAAARRALAARVKGRVRGLAGGLRKRAASRDRHRPLLIAVSGMDGAGKSTVAEAIERYLAEAGWPAELAWARLGSEGRLLDRLAWPVKRLLRRKGTTADPIAAGGPTVAKHQERRAAAGRRGLVTWAWIVAVALINAQSYRRAAKRRRDGISVVCDRWATDAVVDLELRYGRHRLAEAIVRRLPPHPDLLVLLEVDADTALQRKPGDQAERVLAGMERLYAARTADGVVRVDARCPADEVRRVVLGLVESLIRARR